MDDIMDDATPTQNTSQPPPRKILQPKGRLNRPPPTQPTPQPPKPHLTFDNKYTKCS
ncbi:hypothetical protein L13192_09313 [Pyrenophora tritici-repentis]|uniref:Uncharacterized protein n=1 Tax=Pyrenophora tritici-repentis TaxID=45151 RepID=A0A922NEF2_9PLEO|nr:hypothetical protein Ptr86124_007147 [Pyrenophora tritici-repentis]KAI1667069.1 hypothetical protein L13192_09313 [Pyrenophora tritici-repentis]KAI1682917.1 hypothetical protein KJE20_07649 [Pyrenophora tritici-repentis]